MTIRPIYSSKLPGLVGALAITLYPFVLFGQDKITANKWRVIHHECVHVRQVRTVGWWRFYLSYVWEWFKLVMSGVSNDSASRLISWETEAYEQESKLVMTPEEQAEFLL